MSPPFRRVLVPYDGAEPSERALAFGIGLGRTGAALDIVHFVDETSVISQSATSVGVFDPTLLIDALDAQGRAFLNAAADRCRGSSVEVSTNLIHERPIPGIIGAAEKNGDQLIVLGTHARSGMPRTFLGSTTEGVLRSGTMPILAVSAQMAAPSTGPLFQKVLVAVDESDPADAAVTVAGELMRSLGSECVLCTVIDTRELYDKAATYGYDPTLLAGEIRAHAQIVIDRARLHGHFGDDAVTAAIIEDEPARGIIAEATRRGADAIVMGSHGRRGLQRLFLGSVAEHVVRHSPIPVFVVRS